MRIRKRKVPLPLSLLSPIPLSDPHLFSRSPVIVVQSGGTSTSDDTSIKDNSIHSQPSDHFTLTSLDTSTSDLHRLIIPGNSTLTGVEGVVPANNDDASNASLTTIMRAGATPTVDDDDDDDDNNNNAGEWCDGDKAIRLKKRRGSFNSFIEDNNTIIATVPASITIGAVNCKPILMKNDVKSGVSDEAKASNNRNEKKGNNKRGNTIMEGSRCSRVNGRGWRCCQPTLVGYSLCEHHLGKGRLRSMTSGTNIKARTTAKKKSNSSSRDASSSSPLGRDERKRVDYDNDDYNAETKKLEDKNSFGNNKRVKLGVVKARSLSSLLGQTTMEHHEKVIGQL